MRFISRFTLLILVSLSSTLYAADKQIVGSADEVIPILNGVKIPPVTLNYPDGSPVSLSALAMQKPSIILFYRGGWCPYCNRQFAELQNVEDDLVALGYQILAISPQTSEALNDQKMASEMLVQQLSDASLTAIKEFGIGYYLDEKTTQRYKKNNIPLASDDTGKSVLPAPAVFIVDQKGVVQFSYVNPNYRVRPSAKLILAVATSLAN